MNGDGVGVVDVSSVVVGEEGRGFCVAERRELLVGGEGLVG